MTSPLYHLSDDVRAAIGSRRALVALESTVIAHGLPQPDNLETALACERAVDDRGATPATVAVFDGEIRVGCSRDEIVRLATESGFVKLSIRDLPVVVAQKGNGATTVATTVYLASRAAAELQVFATGGIGGVHRQWGRTLDISADLPALAATDMVVVCAGAKAILDLAATREWLETAGITVVGYQTDEFPAFYSRSSGLPVDVRVDAPAEVAELVRARRALAVRGATLVCVPAPKDVALAIEEVEAAIAEGVRDAAAKGVSGKALTPFLLAHVVQATKGRGLIANKALLIQNARVAAEVANALVTLGVSRVAR
jgi:pseudouridine-5'-phosphate glycosidase